MEDQHPSYGDLMTQENTQRDLKIALIDVALYKEEAARYRKAARFLVIIMIFQCCLWGLIIFLLLASLAA